ncbi:MAG: DUF1294 domain-containing protein [Clostridia bacterium]|nr:DUF1294 domain-containing protein [Clostridia bacterium]
MTKYIIYFVVWNVLVALIYGIDKNKAQRGAWRIPEKTLLLLAFLGGGIGAFCGMHIFHHKTKKNLFKIGVPLCIVANVAEVVAVIWLIERAGATLL